MASEIPRSRIRHVSFAGKKAKKDISILTETHINHDQIYHIRSNWLGFIFFSPGVVTQKEYISYFIRVLRVSLRSTLIQKRGLCPLRGLPQMTEFSLFIPFQRTREHLVREPFFEGLQDYMLFKSWIVKTHSG